MAHSNYGQQAKTPLFTKKYTLSAACERSLAILDSQKKQQISHCFIVQQLPKDCNGEAADKVYFKNHFATDI
jgi:N-acetyl-anhydromuramyl-L-alanine amidase AmpD